MGARWRKGVRNARRRISKQEMRISVQQNAQWKTRSYRQRPPPPPPPQQQQPQQQQQRRQPQLRQQRLKTKKRARLRRRLPGAWLGVSVEREVRGGQRSARLAVRRPGQLRRKRQTRRTTKRSHRRRKKRELRKMTR